MDKPTKEQRHRCMSAIKGKDTKPELQVRNFLFSRGFRYRLNHPRLPGHPYLEDRRIKSYETTEEEYSMVAEPVECYGESK